jgi:hypothetical protein
MALVKVTKQIVSDPESIKAMYTLFENVEELNNDPHSLYKIFRVKGQGLPNSDKYIKLEFVRTLQGETRIKSWEYADELTGL